MRPHPFEPLVIPPSPVIAWVSTTPTSPAAMSDTFPTFEVTDVEWGEVGGIPDPEPGTIYITTAFVASRTPRPDVFSPGRNVRVNGKVVGCHGLRRTMNPTTAPASPATAPQDQHPQPPADPTLAALCERTGYNPEDWVEVDGPTTGVGVERWFTNKTRDPWWKKAYCCDDQGHVTVELFDACDDSIIL